MAVYEFEIEGGEIVPIDAPDYATAVKALKVILAGEPPSAPVTARGLGEQGVASLGTGTASLIGLPGTIARHHSDRLG